MTSGGTIHDHVQTIIKGIDFGGRGARFVNAEHDAELRKGNREFSQIRSDEAYGSDSTDSESGNWRDRMPVNDSFGFAFLPLGRVEAVPDSAWNPDEKRRNMIWRDTGYILGVLTNGRRGNRPGSCGEVWLLFDMFEENPDASEKNRIEDHEDDFGCIKSGDPDTRSGIRIAESFEDLHDGFEWQVEKFIEGSYTMTKAILWLDKKRGQIILREDLTRKTAWKEEMRKSKTHIFDEPDFRRRC